MNDFEQAVRRQLGALALPLFVAPMFLISSPRLVVAACRAGVVGSFPTPNARTAAELDRWLNEITGELDTSRAESRAGAPWAANLVVHTSNTRMADDLALVQRYRAPIVITALGSPARVMDAVKSYGGLVFTDVNSVEYASKAAAVGVDGLVLVCSGAGGHTGLLNSFAFVSEVQRFWDGYLIVAGGISAGRDIRAVEALGADFAYMGTSFIATDESHADPAYKQMVVDCSAADLVPSRAFTGVLANWMRPSITARGLDPDAIATKEGKINFTGHEASEQKAWKGVWSAGQGVGAVTRVQPAAQLIAQLKDEYDRHVQRVSATLAPTI